MGRKRIPGLVKRGEVWHINKKVKGERICESTGSANLEEAERYLVHKLETMRQAAVYGIRPKRTFREAAVKFVQENGHKASLCDDIGTIKRLDAFIGHLTLEAVHMGSLQKFIDARKVQNLKARTVNKGLQLTRHILKLAASSWRDEHGMTWLASAPTITLLPLHDARKACPLSWEEQSSLFKELAPHLAKMALFAVNTGCRDAEICNLRWEWEFSVPELGAVVFIVPAVHVKNREDRLVVLNEVALSVIEEVRGEDPEYVFVYNHKPIQRMLNSGWIAARRRSGLSNVRVHDLKHTFGRRLRSAGVSFEDRQDLLGHKSQRITTHYSAAEIHNLLAAANKVCSGRGSPLLTLVKGSLQSANPRLQHAATVGVAQKSRRRLLVKGEKYAK